MEELNDDELQELLSRDNRTDNNLFSQKENTDLRAYQELFNVLDTEPAQGLPLSFAANVRRKLQEQLNRKNDMKFNILAIAIFTVSLALAYSLLAVISPATGNLILNVVLKFRWVLITVISMFFCFLLADQRLVKREY